MRIKLFEGTCRLPQPLESDGRIDVVAENRFSDFNLAGNELLDGFEQTMRISKTETLSLILIADEKMLHER
jgi:hypothetical protein